MTGDDTLPRSRSDFAGSTKRMKARTGKRARAFRLEREDAEPKPPPIGVLCDDLADEMPKPEARSRTRGTVPVSAEKMATPARVSCKSAEHYTPVAYADAAHYVLGAIDLDPASCAAANRLIRARQYYTKAQHGQFRPWFGRVWCNPPGDKLGELVPAFWRRANEHVLTGAGSTAVLWAGFTLEQLRSLQNAGALEDGRRCPSPGDWPRVVIGGGAPQASSGGRIYWIDGATGKPGKQPTHGNFFALLGGDAGMRARFRERFGQWGDYSPGRRKVFAAQPGGKVTNASQRDN